MGSSQEQSAMLGVPLHGDDVAPRFCSAHEFAIAELDGGRVSPIFRLTIRDESWSKRLERLSDAGVEVLLCGGFNRRFLPHAEALGIRVISGLAGEAERLIAAYARDEIEQYRFLPCRGRRGGRHGARWSRQRHDSELRGRKGAMPCRDTTEPVRLGPDRSRGEVVAAAGDPRTERQE
jgi:predicted Fe-Mo cluster-binding NifX family protein